jgi:tRNA (guanine-N7-)-methyltransferase
MVTEAEQPVPRREPHVRGVRSYVVRAGRTTGAQRRALDDLWPRYGVEGAGRLDARALFGRDLPLAVEVGFGNGEALLELAATHPDRGFLGIEVYPPGVGRLLQRLAARGLENVRVLREDATGVFEERVAEASLAAVYVWFPDPWPKKRHHKRRLLQPPFVAAIARSLAPAGRLHLATDWEDYARQMVEVTAAEPLLINPAGPGRFAEGPGERPATRFERRGRRLGHRVWDLVLERRPQGLPVASAAA